MIWEDKKRLNEVIYKMLINYLGNPQDVFGGERKEINVLDFGCGYMPYLDAFISYFSQIEKVKKVNIVGVEPYVPYLFYLKEKLSKDYLRNAHPRIEITIIPMSVSECNYKDLIKFSKIEKYDLITFFAPGMNPHMEEKYKYVRGVKDYYETGRYFLGGIEKLLPEILKENGMIFAACIPQFVEKKTSVAKKVEDLNISNKEELNKKEVITAISIECENEKYHIKKIEKYVVIKEGSVSIPLGISSKMLKETLMKVNIDIIKEEKNKYFEELKMIEEEEEIPHIYKDILIGRKRK